MAYGYYGKRYSYESPKEEFRSNDSIEELITNLKESILSEKLKDIKSLISKLKLSNNDDFPLWTKKITPFSAYIFAIKNNKDKAATNILKALLKTKFTFDGSPLKTLLTHLNKNDFKIVLNDYFLNPDSIFYLDDNETIELMFRNFPSETNRIIHNAKLNKFLKGEERLQSLSTIFSFSDDIITLVLTLGIYYGSDYVNKFGMNQDKLEEIKDILENKSTAIKRKLLNEYFYKTYEEFIRYDIFISDIEQNNLDDNTIKNFISNIIMANTRRAAEFLEILHNDNKILSELLDKNEDLLTFVTNNKPELLPDSLRNIFLF